VVFDSTPQEERFETDNFDDLAAALLQPITETRTELQQSIHGIGLEIVKEERLRDELPQQENAVKQTGDAIVRIRKELQDLLPKESAEHAKALTDLETLCSQAEMRIEAIRKRRKLLDDLGVDVRQVRQVREPSRFREMQTRFAGTGLTHRNGPISG